MCQQCGKFFVDDRAVKLHAAKVHNPDKPPAPPKPYTPRGYFTCKYEGCNFGNEWQSRVNKHMKLKHEVLEPVACDLCGLLVKHKYSMYKHKKWHKRKDANQIQAKGKWTVERRERHQRELSENARMKTVDALKS